MKPRTAVNVEAPLENSRLDWLHVTNLLNTCFRKETLSRHPSAAMNLLQAFDEAMTNSLKRLSTIVNSLGAIPWSYDAFRSAQKVFGEDLWPYGVEANHPTLEAFLQYCHEPGATARRVAVEEVAVEELFPPETSKAFKV
jgi:4,5-dihydroxyphthalate decarboxylase